MPTTPAAAPSSTARTIAATSGAAATNRRSSSPPSRVSTTPRAAASSLVGRSEFASEHGLSFHSPLNSRPQRDLYDALGYSRVLRPKDYRDRYERGGIARRIVDAAPNETWARGSYVMETMEDIDTDFEIAINRLFSDLEVWERLNRVDVLAGLGRYAVLLIGAPGSLESPLPSLAPLQPAVGKPKVSPIAFIAPYDETAAKIVECVEDVSNPRYGLPLYYQLILRTVSSGRTKTEHIRVHWTRIVHVAEGLLDSEIYGEPRLRAVWNNLDDLDKIVGGGAEAAWKRMDPGLQIDVDPEFEMTDEQEEALNDEVDEYQHNLRRVMRTRGATITPLAATVASFATNATSVLKLISGTAGIPQRVLLGSERGELASTQDRDNWADRIDERRRRFAEPLVRDLVRRLVDRRAVPPPSDENSIAVLWPRMEELTEIDKAKLVSQLAAANSSQSASGGGIILSGDEIRDKAYGMPPAPGLAAVKPPKAAAAEGSNGSAAPRKDKGEGE